LLRLRGRRDRLLRRGKDVKEGVPLRVHLDTAVDGESLPQCAPVLSERVGIGVAQLVEQPRRALHVGEEEGDGAGRKATPHGRHHERWGRLCRGG
jgi:hypothetical protein